jgi:hypothetical protein
MTSEVFVDALRGKSRFRTGFFCNPVVATSSVKPYRFLLRNSPTGQAAATMRTTPPKTIQTNRISH